MEIFDPNKAMKFTLFIMEKQGDMAKRATELAERYFLIKGIEEHAEIAKTLKGHDLDDFAILKGIKALVKRYKKKMSTQHLDILLSNLKTLNLVPEEIISEMWRGARIRKKTVELILTAA